MNVIGGFDVADTAGYQKIRSIRIINWNKVNKHLHNKSVIKKTSAKK
jgi:hypothetical protein